MTHGLVFRQGSSAIYSILDWSKPGSTTLVCIGTLIFLILLHFFTYGMYRLRVCIFNALKLERRFSKTKTAFDLETVKRDEKLSQQQTGITNNGFVPESV